MYTQYFPEKPPALLLSLALLGASGVMLDEAIKMGLNGGKQDTQ